MGLFSNFFGSNNPISVTRDSGGNWFYKIWSSLTGYGSYATTTEKITAYHTNPALHKVISLIQNVGSLANFNLYINDKLTTKNYLYTLKAKPNPYQSWTDFVNEFLFWNSIGTAYYFKDSGTNELNRNSYWLNHDNFDDKTKRIFTDLGKKPTLSNKNEALRENSTHIVKYRYNGNQTVDIPLKLITPIHSETPMTNWFEGGSVIDSLKKVISNCESSLDAKNVNLHFAQKYLLFSKTSLNDHQGAITGFTSKTEKDDLKAKMGSDEKVVVSGAENIELKRFVERFKEMGFDDSFLNDYLIIGIAFGVPMDLLENWLKGKGLTSQGDSMEKSMVRFVEMVLMPKLQKFTDVLEYDREGNQEVKAEFTHLGFMRVVATEKATQLGLDLANLTSAQALGLDAGEVKRQLKVLYNGN